MLIPAMKTDSAASSITRNDPDPICISAPTMMIDEIALVIAISGVCRLCATFQITWKPTKTARTKTMKCCMKLAGRDQPHQQHQRATNGQQGDLLLGLRLEGRDLLRAFLFRRQFLDFGFLLRRNRLHLWAVAAGR